ncbi:type II secretion system F family protein [Alicyclobacillus macrosporangiidus]|uniref:Type IV pilus assembly protein PilC n=1 Tax=Alicyclobacillus macrosporangiidus TaxID=392015 RepID=A0A1I7JVT2_9BACL|nr:type II secretion system F family protein [Alicyclobacillus macrosporangiidus]SFU89301.1 type IV pilus assembly protein PilC [Alicyclobacillus macrosporangiidus]
MKFAYTASTLQGKTRRGILTADSRADAIAELREQGLYVTRLTEVKGLRAALNAHGDSIWTKDIPIGKKVKAGEFAAFCRQLAALVRSGVTIGDAVRVLSEQSENKALGKALADVSRDLRQGNQLSQAAAKHKNIFPPMFTNMVKAGEVSGHLDEVLDRLSTFYEKEYYTREKVKSALTYPIIVSILAVIVTVFMMVKIVPTFVSLFASFNATLPLPTRIVIGVSNVFTHFWWELLILLVLLMVGYKWLMRQSRPRYIRDTILLKLPVFGTLLRKSVMARMARTMSSLFASAVPVLQSLELTADVVSNAVVERALKRCAENLSSGQSLTEPFATEWVFPPLVVHMIRVGEETGNLDHMLTKVAEFYEAETEAIVDRLKSLLEPILMLILAGVVGIIITAVIMPMFSLESQLSNMG